MTPRLLPVWRLTLPLALALCALLAVSPPATAQTQPAPQSIPYTQDFSSWPWGMSSYPLGWQGWKGNSTQPIFDMSPPVSDDYVYPNGDASRPLGQIYNYDGKIGQLDEYTGRQICLAVSTLGRTGVRVSFDVMTIRNPYGIGGDRISELTLQYRVGGSGAFTSIGGTYQNNTTPQTSGTTPQNLQTLSCSLPPSCDNQSYVQLRWVTRDVSGGGNWPSFALDNISVTSGAVPTVDGVINPGEYGNHTNGYNMQTASDGRIWYVTWDDNALYVGIQNAILSEGAVLYLDRNPVTPVNGGTTADGNLVGQLYDNTNFSNLQFRADLVVYFKDGYREARTAAGGGWSGPMSGLGTYASSGNTREVAIPWSTIGGRPATFDWFGYITTAGGIVYGQVPLENAGGTIGAGARWERYYTVSNGTPFSGTPPFSRNSFVYNYVSSTIGALNAFDFSTSASIVARTAGTWNIGGDLVVFAGGLDFSGGDACYVAGSVKLVNGGQLHLGYNGTSDLYVGGSLDASGGNLQSNNRWVIFNGTSPQTYNYPGYLDKVRINNDAGLTLSDALRLNQTLDLYRGRITTGSYAVTLGPSAMMSGGGSGSYVIGNVEKAVQWTGSYLLHIGDAASYGGLQVMVNSLGSPFALRASTTAGDHPQIGTSGIAAARSVNRYWSLTGSPGSVSYDATFYYVSGDVDPGANNSNFIVGRYAGGAWHPTTTGMRGTGYTQATGLAEFGDFAIGEPACTYLTLLPATLPDGVRYQYYSQTISATGGSPPYTFTLGNGSLPPGLSLSPSGTLSGTCPTSGAWSFTVKAQDAYNCYSSTDYILTLTEPTYTWNGSVDYDWQKAANWTPARTAPTPYDALRFGPPGCSVWNVPTQTIAQLLVMGSSTFVQLRSSAPAMLTISGGAGTDLDVPSGCELELVYLNPISVVLSPGATAMIGGWVRFMDAAHRLDAATSGAIQFATGSVFSQGPGCTDHPFGTTGASEVAVFQSGSRFEAEAGEDPFALTPPQSKVRFEPGSAYRVQTAMASLSPFGRTYGDLDIAAGTTTTYNLSGADPLTLHTLRLSGGTLNVGLTGAIHIKGDLWLMSGSLAFTGAGTVTLDGVTQQTVGGGGGGGGITFDAGRTLEVTNPAGIALQSDLSVPNLTLAGGDITVMVFRKLTIPAGGTVNRTSGHVVGTLEMGVGPGPRTLGFHIGDATHYTPVWLAFADVTTPGTVTATTSGTDHPQLGSSILNGAKSVNRYWTLTNSGTVFTTCEADLVFDAADRDPGADYSAFYIGKWNGAAWSYPDVGGRSANDIKAPALTSLSDFAVAEVAAWTITATAGPNGSITPSGVVPVAHHGSQAFDILPDPGYRILDVLVDDGSVGTPASHTFSDVTSNHTISATFALLGSVVDAVSPAACITPGNPCVTVPVTITRHDADQLRGFSVDLALSGNLALCGAGIAEGGYLSGAGSTHFEVTDNGGGSYTVDCAILGLPCGATAPSGTLFEVPISSVAPSGTGTVTVTGVTLRDCDNGAMPGSIGAAAGVTIDNEVPGAVVLSAAQVLTGNDADGTTQIGLSWTGAVAPGDTVLIFRKGFGAYPEYDDGGGAAPATPAWPPAGWTPVAAVPAPATACNDEPDTRDFWYYIAFVRDACGSVGPASNRTGGTLSYHLGDVHDGGTDCQGDNLVSTPDVSFLGAHYGAVLAHTGDPLACLDVGPTTDRSVSARPLTDDRLQFEDLMVFAMNFGEVSAPQATAGPAPTERDELTLEAPARVAAGQEFDVSLRLSGTGGLKGLSAQLGWDAAVCQAGRVEPGPLATAQGVTVLSTGAGGVDAAALGAGRGIGGEGVLAVVRFRALAAGTPRLTLASVDARDATNRQVALGASVPSQAPATTTFAPPAPNPSSGTTLLSLGLATEDRVELTIYSVDGRRVATLVDGVRAPGWYDVAWDGAGARAGLYFARLVTSQGCFTRTLVRVH